MAIARAARWKAVPLLVALAFPALALAPLAAAGEPRGKASASDAGGQPAEKYDPDNVTAISQYMETIVKATALFQSKNRTGAVDTYRMAIQLNPRHPLAHLMLAQAYVSMGNLGEADAAIAQAFDTETKDARLRSHVLFVRADLFERQQKWDQAKVAWQAYMEHAAKFADAGAFPQSGAERLKALEKVAEQDKAYVAVRERIAAEKAAAPKPTSKR